MLTDYKKPSAVFSVFLLCLISILIAGLALDDPMVFMFFIPLSAFLAVAMLMAKRGTPEQRLQKAGVEGGKNLPFNIAIGLFGSLICLATGSLILDGNLMGGSLIWCFSPIASHFQLASIGNYEYSKLFYIGLFSLFQLCVVAPAEELGVKEVIAYALEFITENKIIQYAIAIFAWVLMHIPSYTQNNADIDMFLVLAVWGIIFVILMVITKTLVTPVIAHGFTNIAIICINDGGYNSSYVMLGIGMLAATLMSYHIWKGGDIKFQSLGAINNG